MFSTYESSRSDIRDTQREKKMAKGLECSLVLSCIVLLSFKVILVVRANSI